MASPAPTQYLESGAPVPPPAGNGDGAARPRAMLGQAPKGVAGRVEGRLVAWTALLRSDLASLSRSWVLRGWVGVLTIVTLMVLGAGLRGQGGVPPLASALLAAYLGMFLMVWSTVIIVLSAGSVSSEADIIADSILSRACTRTQYITAKLAARGLVIVGIYALFSGVAGYCAWRYASNDTSFAAIATGIGIVGLALLLLVTLGVMMSVLFNHMLAVIGLLLLWYVAAPIFTFAGAEYLSPTSLTGNLPRILKDSNAPQVVQCSATPTSLTVLYSKDVDPDSAEQIENYLVWCPPKGKRVPTTAVYDRSETRVVLGGMKLPPGKTVKVTVSGVEDAAGNDVSPAADTAKATVTGTPSSDDSKSDSDQTSRRRSSRASASEEERTEGGSAGDQNAKGEAGEPEAGASDDSGAPDEATKAVEGTSPPRSTRRGRREENAPLRVAQCVATASSVKVTFSRPVQAKDAERLRNYVVESPLQKVVKPRTAVYNADERTVLLSGLTLDEDDPVKVTVKNVRDTAGHRLAARGSSATYANVTPWKYLLGFGIPTLLAAFLAVAAFSRRDL